ncbi:hypothetical protein RPE78_02605 [Thioclava litoralis]|uniref:Uncharacterized protein n=1 Tax=Thioclava litoralis TaxID=3076557 RepID=A0ABZ1E2Z3_9RHOB|nr:hypothetical protein RPE78_02605 [Thioclava sp. FTW29]
MHFLKALKDTPPFVSGLLIGFLLAITTYALADSHFQSELFSQWTTFIGAGATLIAGAAAWISAMRAARTSEAMGLVSDAARHVEALLTARHEVYLEAGAPPLVTNLAMELSNVSRALGTGSLKTLRQLKDEFSTKPKPVAQSYFALHEAAAALAAGYVTLFSAAKACDQIVGGTNHSGVQRSRHGKYARQLAAMEICDSRHKDLLTRKAD